MRFGCFVEDTEQFDASAFRLAAGEAVSLDPQARILLEQTGQAFAQAGQAFARAWDAATGVYVGCMYTEYLDSVLGPLVRLVAYSLGLLALGQCLETSRSGHGRAACFATIASHPYQMQHSVISTPHTDSRGDTRPQPRTEAGL